METSTVIAILSLATVVMGSQFAMWRWLVTKLREDRAAASQSINDLHRRVDDVKDNYVRRDDLMQHISRIERGQAEHSSLLQAGLERINGRIDSFVGSSNAEKTG